MGVFKKENLETLREKIDLIEVLSSYLQLRPAGATYKALCPFHEEKTPSFVVQRTDSHYHCFGCGAHGDAIAFLMSYLKMSFVEAVESLADRFHVPLEEVDGNPEDRGPKKSHLKEILTHVSKFFHFLLLYSDEGHQALKYLYNRGIDLEFIELFQIGFASKTSNHFYKAVKGLKYDALSLEKAGLLKNTQKGEMRPFFSNRIMFPIRDPLGHVIGFSGRKLHADTFGPKYINTPETLLFKKSKVLFGLNYCRKRIAKEKKAIVVEGQIDALMLIQSGFNFTVAGQGSAFGSAHVLELIKLGVNHVYIAFDGDIAGREATMKVGDLFQKEGLEVNVLAIPEGCDPDTVLREYGPKYFITLLDQAEDYLTFLLDHLSKDLDLHSPSKKNQLIQTIVKLIRGWDHPLMVHESLRKLARLTEVPETLVGVGHDEDRPELKIKKEGSISQITLDPDRILEVDILRWLYLVGQSSMKIVEITRNNLKAEHFKTTICRRFFNFYFENCERKQSCDLLSLAINIEGAEDQLLLSELLHKRINPQRAEEGVLEVINKILHRYWLDEREKIKIQIQSGRFSEEEAIDLAKKFDEIRRNPPLIQLSEGK